MHIRSAVASRFSRMIISAWCSIVASASLFAFCGETSPAPGPAAQVWLISTRGASGCGNLEADLSTITYHRLEESCGSGRWQASDAATFQASAHPTEPTIVLIHGNRTDDDWAVRHGNALYGLLKQQAGGCPFRLVVWSWPADRVARRTRPDVQIKVCRSDVEAYYLARLLACLPKGTPLSLVGYSLGCRTAGGSLQLLAGGTVADRRLAPEILATWNHAGRRPIRVMMLAAAMDADRLEPPCAHGLAPLAIERILVTTNDRDRVLKWYSHLYGRHGPEALGYIGPAGHGGRQARRGRCLLRSRPGARF